MATTKTTQTSNLLAFIIAGPKSEWNQRELSLEQVAIICPTEPQLLMSFQVPSMRKMANDQLRAVIQDHSLPVYDTLYAIDMEVRPPLILTRCFA